MATLTIRNLDEEVKRDIRRAAAERGVSMEQEARDRLGQSVGSTRRKKVAIEEILALGIKPDAEVDLKELTDRMWDEGLMPTNGD